MGNKARNYTDKTLKRLFGLSGNICAFPGCPKVLVNKNNAKDSNICHIEAANPDGERYNPNMTDKQRADYPNLILLCVQHHDETNDEEIYKVEVLKKMKSDHESAYLNEKLKQNPSMLKNAINAIAEIDVKIPDNTEKLKPFKVDDKIEHNNIEKYISIITEYKVYYEKLNSLYDELEMQGSIKKEKLLRNIRQIYIAAKGELLGSGANDIENIRTHADEIMDMVYDELYNKLTGSGLWDEDIVLGLRLIMVDAFLRCEILEEPPTKV